MSFLSAWRLIFLLLVPLLGAIYFWAQERRENQALRLSSTELLASVAQKVPWWKRHLSTFVFLLALAILIVGFAKPAKTVKVPVEKAVVIVALDVSISMEATDVDPTRLDAAKDAAAEFIRQIPDTLDVGLVSFAETAAVEVPPTTDHDLVVRAIDRLETQPATSIGDAIRLSIRTSQNAVSESGEDIPTRIVLLSDGFTTSGIPETEAIEIAQQAAIPVNTISFGTRNGVVEIEDPFNPGVIFTEPVPVAEKNLETIADETGGLYFQARSLEELDKVYENIGAVITIEEDFEQITDWFLGFGLLTLFIAAGLGLTWQRRLA